MMHQQDSERLHINVQPADTIRGPPDAYKNQSDPRGALFISNCRRFDDSDRHAERLGSDRDVDNLKRLFTGVGYDCTCVVEDLTREDLLRKLDAFKDHEIHQNVDSLVAVFMSHGDENRLLTRDGEYVKVDEICNRFDDYSCPMLQGKPKVFFFQHCRGTTETAISSIDFVSDGRPIAPAPRNYPKPGLSHAFICFSTRRGFVSYRDTLRGGVFVENLCKVVMEKAKDKRLSDLIAEVNFILSKDNYQQSCEMQFINHHYPFYFNPVKHLHNESADHFRLVSLLSAGLFLSASLLLGIPSPGSLPPGRFQASYPAGGAMLMSISAYRLSSPSLPSLSLLPRNLPSVSFLSVCLLPMIGIGALLRSRFVNFWQREVEALRRQGVSNSVNTRTSLGQHSESPTVLASSSSSPTAEERTQGARKKKTKQQTYVFILSYLLGCDEDIRNLEFKFSQMDFEVMRLPPVQTLVGLKKLLRSKVLSCDSTAIVFFYGEGYDNYIYLGKDSTESISFKAFIEAFRENVMRERPTVVFTNSCFNYRRSTTILGESSQPLWNAYHACIKVNGNCSKGSVFTTALLHQLGQRNPEEGFVDFAHRIKRKVEVLDEDDQYIVDIRTYGVYTPYQFPQHSQ